MKGALKIWRVRNLILTFLFLIISFAILPSTSNPISEDIYFNPWSKINKVHPKIIQFGSDGTYKLKELGKDQLFTLKSTIQALRTMDESVNEIIDELHNYIINVYESTNFDKKLKILTNCNKSRSMCRFLACPNIKSHCTLCEVNINDPFEKPTTCEHFGTKHLTK